MLRFFFPQHVLNLLAMLNVMYTLTGWLISWLAWQKNTELQSGSCVKVLFDLAAEQKQTPAWFI